jgi:hypothetical protein
VRKINAICHFGVSDERKMFSDKQQKYAVEKSCVVITKPTQTFKISLNHIYRNLIGLKLSL